MQPSPISVAVSDFGPLIALARLDRQGVLPALFGRILVPEAVLDVCTARPELVDAPRIRQACESGSLTVCVASPIKAAHLGPGECSAIGKALELKAPLLGDDLAARRPPPNSGCWRSERWARSFVPSGRDCCRPFDLCSRNCAQADTGSATTLSVRR